MSEAPMPSLWAARNCRIWRSTARASGSGPAAGLGAASAEGSAQIAMGRGDDADIGADRLPAANGGELALLQYAQQAGLRLGRHIADLVEEQRAAGGLLEASLVARGGASEGAAFMAEEL